MSDKSYLWLHSGGNAAEGTGATAGIIPIAAFLNSSDGSQYNAANSLW